MGPNDIIMPETSSPFPVRPTRHNISFVAEPDYGPPLTFGIYTLLLAFAHLCAVLLLYCELLDCFCLRLRKVDTTAHRAARKLGNRE